MASIRQEKVATLLKKELSMLFQRQTNTLCMGSMVSATIVRVTPDMSSAKVYLSIFASQKPDEVFENVKANTVMIRHELSQLMRNQLRRIPVFTFYIDDSIDYAEKIEELLK
ncbi:MAG: ribosome-binding factor A [Parvicella sp.]|jgi:ribosome-binding factor A